MTQTNAALHLLIHPKMYFENWSIAFSDPNKLFTSQRDRAALGTVWTVCSLSYLQHAVLCSGSGMETSCPSPGIKLSQAKLCHSRDIIHLPLCLSQSEKDLFIVFIWSCFHSENTKLPVNWWAAFSLTWFYSECGTESSQPTAWTQRFILYVAEATYNFYSSERLCIS